jgi:hypothetical protein
MFEKLDNEPSLTSKSCRDTRRVIALHQEFLTEIDDHPSARMRLQDILASAPHQIRIRYFLAGTRRAAPKLM